MSPPTGVAAAAAAGGGNNDIGKLYRKSPFMQRKLSNGSHYKYNDESPKKESVFSSIGQSILRNLTTSPFSQKKHQPIVTATTPTATTATTTPTTLPHHNKKVKTPTELLATPKWRLPYDTCDSSIDNVNLAVSSPTMQRKHLIMEQTMATATATATTTTATIMPTTLQLNNQQQQQQQLQQQRLQPGNQSPIVLQRFYHQQNQLREKEAAERQQQHQLQQQQQQHLQQQHHLQQQQQLPQYYQMQQQQQQQPQSSPQLYHFLQSPPPVPPLTPTLLRAAPATTTGTSTNPFHSNYVAPPSSHSTSSQSSTQSTCSQIASAAPASPCATAAGHFGVGNAAQLQYQPLPLTPTTAATPPAAAAAAATASDISAFYSSSLPSRSPEQLQPDYGTAQVAGSKLSKLYARRQLLGQQPSNSSNNLEAREQQHVYSTQTDAATAQTLVNGNEQEPAQALAPPPAPPAYRNIGNNGTATTTNSSSSHNHNHNTTAKTYYYRTLSAASSSSSSHSHNTSQSTSPTTEPLTGSAAVVHSIGGATATSGFLRRYASSGIVAGNHSSGSNSTPPSPHLLAGLDRRHRSPDPPPRYNRGQSPLLLRKNLLELSGQPAGSPLLQRRYVSASPPLPPPRRGSESVPGSPQHFRTRIHYTPEPQRRIYRTIDQ